jgi:uncharacterized membrane protein
MEIVMNTTDRIIQSAFASLLAVGLAAGASQAFAAKGDTEKCAGIAKAGKNDCGTSKNACAGQVKVDNDAEAWISVPKGTCERISGGHIQTSADAKHGGKS